MDGCGCPKCGNIISIGEQRIIQYLENNDIKYSFQHRFENCRYKNTLPFDFYIEQYKVCIEFDGEHHFNSIEYFGGEENFKKQKKKDHIKNSFCIDNGIKLIRISKPECDQYGYEQIEKILNEVFYGL